jgi:cyclopropane fatty-acyl-phospholipid synthase-like methyltransferase
MRELKFFEKMHELKDWECMMKQLLWRQLGTIEGKKILDFGSGFGVTAAHLAQKNEVVAIEPSEESIANRWQDYPYTQLQGSVECIKELKDESFET